ncbi:MAG: hypothetical protein JSR99_14445 [Proteobacteria bacterium]|nr:hypothetical protein [Pseudomonadota bacterium]
MRHAPVDAEEGGGDHENGHRCAGEWITIETLKFMSPVSPLSGGAIKLLRLCMTSDTSRPIW